MDVFFKGLDIILDLSIITVKPKRSEDIFTKYSFRINNDDRAEGAAESSYKISRLLTAGEDKLAAAIV